MHDNYTHAYVLTQIKLSEYIHQLGVIMIENNFHLAPTKTKNTVP